MFSGNTNFCVLDLFSYNLFINQLSTDGCMLCRAWSKLDAK